MTYLVGKGWWPLLDKYLAEIQAVAPGSKVHDIREKYGACRVSIESSVPEKQDEINRITEKLESESEHICEYCGAPGHIQENEMGWLKCMCNSCYINKTNNIPQKQNYLFQLEDCYTPGYFSSTKQYLGTERQFSKVLECCPEKHKNPHLIETFQKFKEDKNIEYHAGQIVTKFAESVEFLETKDISGEGYLFNYENTWSCIYEVLFEKYQIQYILVSCNTNYYICVKAEIYNPKFRDKNDIFGNDSFMPLNSGFWGYPGVIVTEETEGGYIIRNQIYAVEEAFESESEARESLKEINEPLLQSFFEDVFGNG